MESKQKVSFYTKVFNINNETPKMKKEILSIVETDKPPRASED